jgi:type II secretory pathway component PulC
MDTFDECLDNGRYAAQVAADAELAQSLGLSAVPAVFVNGTYASPAVQAADLVWLIEAELAAGNVASPRMVTTEAMSTAPFRLEALIASPVPGQGMVLMSPSAEPSRMAAFREGDLVTTGTVLRRIDSEGVDLMRNGRVERLLLGVRSTPLPAAAASPSELGVVSPHRAAPVTLDRDQVLVLLSDRIALAEALEPVPMTTDGQRQLKVTSVEPGSLYELLGIEPGDVIVMVNEQPVTEASNPLWEALEKDGEVRVRVMRRGGLARHFTFRFEN